MLRVPGAAATPVGQAKAFDLLGPTAIECAPNCDDYDYEFCDPLDPVPCGKPGETCKYGTCS